MDYWTIRIEYAALQWHTFNLQVKDGCYISANTKLAAFDKAVRLSSEELARQFSKAIMATMCRRHGEEVCLTVEGRKTSKEIAFDDVMVQARIEQNIFAPNKRPHGV